MSLWNLFQLKNILRSPHRRTKDIRMRIQRASFCICMKGSYTLEVAVVIPLMAAYLVTLLFFFSILEIQCKVDEALLYAGRKTAVESSVVSSEEALLLSAETYLLYALKDDKLVEKYIEHGCIGVQLWNSDFGKEIIVLRADYVVKLPISLWGIGEIKLYSQNMFRKWTGDRLLEENENYADENYVYVTTFGEVYHKDLNCRSIHLSIQSTSIESIFFLRGKNGQIYKECKRCNWENDEKERVYYTDYGEWYHKNIACSSIKRTVDKISIEEVGNRRPCNYCYAG